MADLRIFSYLPNPRLYKATIAARYSGAELEIVGAAPRQLADWLWDYDARALAEGEKDRLSHLARQAKTGFAGTLYKTDAFLAANPFGDVPAAFGAAGDVGIFESNSIMRAAARLGPEAGGLLGGDALGQSRVDGFLDRSLVFAREVQRYLLSGRKVTADVHREMASALASYLGGIEQALTAGGFLAGEGLTLADVAFACELCLFSRESGMEGALHDAGLTPLLPELARSERAHRHLLALLREPTFAKDLAPYEARLAELSPR